MIHFMINVTFLNVFIFNPLHKAIAILLFHICPQTCNDHFLFVVLCYNIPKTEAECKRKIREEFRRHAHLTDLRIIDTVIIRVGISLSNIQTDFYRKYQQLQFQFSV